MRLPEVNFFDDKDGKPIAFNQHIGGRPIAAFGNSDGDLQMLHWTAASAGPRFCLYVHHTDAAREWAYDRASSVGKLDKGLDEASANGWTAVDMKDDGKLVFAQCTLRTTARPAEAHGPDSIVRPTDLDSAAWQPCCLRDPVRDLRPVCCMNAEISVAACELVVISALARDSRVH